MATRSAARVAARGQTTRSGKVPQSRIDEQLTRPLSLKDKRLTSVASNVRTQEAKRRLGDPETSAGRPGTNLCRFAGDDTKMAGKRPSYYTEKTVGRAGMSLCKDVVDEAWNDPAFLAEQKRVCGENKEYVFAHTRKNGVRVKGHCRNLHAPRPRAKKSNKADPRQKQLNALIRKRDATQNLTKYSELARQIKALRAEMGPKPVLTEPDDISGFEFTSVRPKSKRPVLTEPDDISGFDFTSMRPKKPVRPVSKPNAAMRGYIDSLPRGSKKRATDAFRVYMTGPERYTADEALSAYKLMLSRDDQVVGDTVFDDSGEEDQDLGEFDGGSYYTDAQMQQQRDIIANARDNLLYVNEEERSTDDVRGDQPFSPARLEAYGLTPIYDNAQRQLAAAQTELDTMQRGNALVTRATPAELTVAGSMMAMDPQSEAVANALIGLRGTGHCDGDDALAGAGLTVY
jgi:hypothetical protein